MLKNNFRLPFIYLWTIFGFFIPIGLLAFFNIQLIKAVKKSMAFRKQAARVSSKYVQTQQKDNSVILTVTFIILIIMNAILISPSEIFNFYREISGPTGGYHLTTAFLNFLTTINYSCSFILYISVNAVFRRTIIKMFKNNICSNVSCFKKADFINKSQDFSLKRRKTKKRQVLVARYKGDKYIYSWETMESLM